MNVRGVIFLLGRLLSALAVSLLVPAVVSAFTDGVATWAFLVSAGLSGMSGTALWLLFHQPEDFPFGRREAFVLVASAWALMGLAGALPWVVHYGPSFLVDALFESVSGFTTTGASILADIEGQPKAFLLWRSLTHWLGGMGIIVLGIAILPRLAVGGIELLSAEATGPTSEKLTPRIAQTAKALWGIYAGLTLLESIALWALGMTPFDAVNHAMATMATGGFSTNNASLAGFESPAMEMVVTFFMVLAGINFAVHFQLLRGRLRRVRRDPELRLYLAICAGATLVMAIDLVLRGTPWLDSLRLSVFQAVSVITTTGFATDNYDVWPAFSRGLLFLLMFVGGCAGSTGGSIKVMRVLVVLKKLGVDLQQLVRPHAVLPVRMGDRTVREDLVTNVTTFVLLFGVLFGVGGLLLSAMGIEMVTAFSASAACLTNVGPGFAEVGAVANYSHLPPAAKLVLTAWMLIGRLELYTVLVLPFLGRWK